MLPQRSKSNRAPLGSATDARPRDVWRVCGQPVTAGPGRGCACDGWTSAAQVRAAVARLDAGAEVTR